MDRIDLHVPVKAEYVSMNRLVSSSLASLMGFDIEAIDDIKVCLGEVCNQCIQLAALQADFLAIGFLRDGDLLRMEVSVEVENELDESTTSGLEMSRLIVETLMDDFIVAQENGRVRIEMSRRLEA
jgi:serine/threonine-protein kinase RsbW